MDNKEPISRPTGRPSKEDYIAALPQLARWGKYQAQLSAVQYCFALLMLLPLLSYPSFWRQLTHPRDIVGMVFALLFGAIALCMLFHSSGLLRILNPALDPLPRWKKRISRQVSYLALPSRFLIGAEVWYELMGYPQRPDWLAIERKVQASPISFLINVGEYLDRYVVPNTRNQKDPVHKSNWWAELIIAVLLTSLLAGTAFVVKYLAEFAVSDPAALLLTCQAYAPFALSVTALLLVLEGYDNRKDATAADILSKLVIDSFKPEQGNRTSPPETTLQQLDWIRSRDPSIPLHYVVNQLEIHSIFYPSFNLFLVMMFGCIPFAVLMVRNQVLGTAYACYLILQWLAFEQVIRWLDRDHTRWICSELRKSDLALQLGINKLIGQNLFEKVPYIFRRIAEREATGTNPRSSIASLNDQGFAVELHDTLRVVIHNLDWLLTPPKWYIRPHWVLTPLPWIYLAAICATTITFAVIGISLSPYSLVAIGLLLPLTIMVFNLPRTIYALRLKVWHRELTAYLREILD